MDNFQRPSETGDMRGVTVQIIVEADYFAPPLQEFPDDRGTYKARSSSDHDCPTCQLIHGTSPQGRSTA
jgi:hypothetical protein